ncbi:MAG TPA: hypothetical protein VGF13_08220, partial [Verrucomicrobiae bacterium]
MKLSLRLGHVLCVSVFISGAIAFSVRAAEVNPAPPRMTADKTTNGQPRLVFPYPAAQSYQVFSTDNVTNSYTLDTSSGTFLGPTWIVTNGQPARFYKVSATVMNSNDLFLATVLNRLTYGPSPDDVDHIRAIGADAFIAEQMAGETIADSINTDPPIVNTPLPPIPPTPLNPLTNWIRVSARGTATGNNFGIYLNAAGRVYIDNITLVTGTNADVGTNYIANGDFEDEPLTNNWSMGTSISAGGTMITNSPTVDGLAASGVKCLQLTSRSSTTALTDGLWQPFWTNGTVSSTQRFTLSFSYLPVQNTGTVTLTVRLSGALTATNIVLP